MFRKAYIDLNKKIVRRTAEDRLLFIFFYLKTCPLQQVIAVIFGISRSQANTRLSDILKRAFQ
jgi:hypothetical protein